MASHRYVFPGEVELFPQEGGWYYVAAPADVAEELADLAGGSDRGLIAVTATVGATTWDTSLLPKGDGAHFVALNATVRRAEGLELGDRVEVAVAPRRR